MKLKKVESHLFKEPISGIYYVRMKRAGKKPLFASLDTTNIKIAREEMDKKIREYKGHSPKKHLHRLFKDEVKEFFPYYEKQVKFPTFKRMRSAINHHLLPYWGQSFTGEIQPDSWRAYLDSETGRDLFNDWKAVNLVLGYAYRTCPEQKPILFNPKKNSTVSKEYTDEEINALMAASDHDLRLINYIALKIGARDDEILKLKWSAIDYKNKQIRLNGKTGPRISNAPDSLLVLLKARQKQSQSVWIFPQITNPAKPLDNGTRHNYWDMARTAAGVEGRFHDWKHTAITRMLRSGMTVTWVSKQVGTSPKVIQQIYDKLKIQEIPQIADSVRVDGEESFFSER